MGKKGKDICFGGGGKVRSRPNLERRRDDQETWGPAEKMRRGSNSPICNTSITKKKKKRAKFTDGEPSKQDDEKNATGETN